MSEIMTMGISLAGLMIGLIAWLRADIRRMEDRLIALDSRLSALEHSQAHLEGLLEGLREAIVYRSAA